MIIGIDIDDTLTDIRDEVGAEALKYAKSLNKEIDEKKVVWDKIIMAVVLKKDII